MDSVTKVIHEALKIGRVSLACLKEIGGRDLMTKGV